VRSAEGGENGTRCEMRLDRWIYGGARHFFGLPDGANGAEGAARVESGPGLWFTREYCGCMHVHVHVGRLSGNNALIMRKRL
jgi:hypothetical protein